MLRGVAVLYTDNVVRQQRRLFERHSPACIALNPPASTYRFFLPKGELPHLAKQLAPAAGSVVLLGSGDFHHLSAALLRALARPPRGSRSPVRTVGPPPPLGPTAPPSPAPPPSPTAPLVATSPLALVVIDAHPEWGPAPPGYLHCGSWVPEVARSPWVRATAIVGVGALESMGMVDPRLVRSLAPAVVSGRLRVYPARRATGRGLEAAFSRYSGGMLSRSQRNGRLSHPGAVGPTRKDPGRVAPVPVAPLAIEDGVEAVVSDLLAFIGPGPVYLSIDKDAISPDQIPGTWEGGEMAAGELLAVVEALSSPKAPQVELAGADICGEYVPQPAAIPQLDRGLLLHERLNLQLLDLLLTPSPHPVHQQGGPRAA